MVFRVFVEAWVVARVLLWFWVVAMVFCMVSRVLLVV